MPNMKHLPNAKGYHTMSRYPCADTSCGGAQEEGVVGDEDNAGDKKTDVLRHTSGVDVIDTEDENDDVVIGVEEKVKLNVVKS